MNHDCVSFLHTRKLPVRPATFDDATRSLRAVAASEAPVLRTDPELKIPVAMILLVDGVMIPKNGQVPLLDSHKQDTVLAVLGSVRNFKIVNRVLECDVFFSGTPAGISIAQKYKEGHLTDFSIGAIWKYEDSEVVLKDENRVIEGRHIQGPARVIKKWFLIELSVVLHGADPNAKARYNSEALTQRSELPSSLGPAMPDRPKGMIDCVFWWLAAFMAVSLFLSMLTH